MQPHSATNATTTAGAITPWLRSTRGCVATVVPQRLRAIDTAGLSEQERLSAVLLQRILEETQEGARYKEWELPVTQIHGPDIDIPQLVAEIPFDDVKDCENYILRLRRLPVLFDQLIADMRVGMREGRVAALLVIEKVLAQVNDLAAMGPTDSPFAAPIKKLPDSLSAAERERLSHEIVMAIGQDVIPAYRRFAEFLATQYSPKARGQPGIDSIPDGRAYYAFCIRRNTTLDMSADAIHQIGLDEVRRDEAEMLVIARTLGHADLKAFNKAIKADQTLHFTSAEQLLDVYRGDLRQMEAKLPQLFGTLPQAGLIVEATPAYLERQRPAATYEPGTPDGTRPGRVVVNAYNVRDIELGDAEAIAYHEGVPGHHLQMSIAQELTGLPEFRKQYA